METSGPERNAPERPSKASADPPPTPPRTMAAPRRSSSCAVSFCAGAAVPSVSLTRGEAESKSNAATSPAWRRLAASIPTLWAATAAGAARHSQRARRAAAWAAMGRGRARNGPPPRAMPWAAVTGRAGPVGCAPRLVRSGQARHGEVPSPCATASAPGAGRVELNGSKASCPTAAHGGRTPLKRAVHASGSLTLLYRGSGRGQRWAGLFRGGCHRRCRSLSVGKGGVAYDGGDRTPVLPDTARAARERGRDNRRRCHALSVPHSKNAAPWAPAGADAALL